MNERTVWGRRAESAAVSVRRLTEAALAALCLSLAACVTENGHIHPTTLPNGKAGYAITCNSQRYDRCLDRAARVCGGPYTVLPQDRSSTVRLGDSMPGVGNSELILVSCGAQ